MIRSIYNELLAHFDKIYIITLSDEKERHTAIKNTLNKIGYYPHPKFEFFVTTPFPYNSLIMEAFNVSGRGKFIYPNEYDCARSHYNLVKRSYDKGLNNVLIIEDDMLFNSDVDMWVDMLENMPKDYDVIQFYWLRNHPKVNQLIKQNKRYIKHDELGLWSTACYTLSKKGMKYYIDSMDDFFTVADYPLYNAVDTDLNCYIPTKPMVKLNTHKSRIRTKTNTDINDIYYKDEMKNIEWV